MTRFNLRCGLAVATALALFAVARADDPAASYARVVQMLKDEFKEEKIIRLVQESPTKFTLGAGQIAELKKLGASDRLIQAMQQNGPADVGKSDTRAVILILDCSGSMRDSIPGGGDKWMAARQAALDLLDSVPVGRAVSLIVYGHDARRQCEACDVVRPLADIDAAGKAALRKTILGLQAIGSTPIALSLRMAGRELAKTTETARVVLITDGMETCHGDPVKEAAALKDTYKHLAGVEVIGFALKPDEKKAVALIAEAGGGKFYTAGTANELAEQIRAVRKDIAVGAADPGPAAEAGGEALSAADQKAMHVFVRKTYSWPNGLHTELSVNGKVVGTFSENGVAPVGKYLKKGANTIGFRTFSAYQTKSDNSLTFTFGPAVKKPGEKQYEMTQELWRYLNGGDWKFAAGEYKHKFDPEAKDMTATATLYFGGLAQEKPPGRGDYVLHVRPQYSWNCPVSATVAVNGTQLNSFLSRERSVAITPFLRKGENVVTVTTRGVTNDFTTSSDLTVRVGGPATFSRDRGGLTYPTLREVHAKDTVAWDDAKNVFVSAKNPNAAEGVQEIKFTVDELPVKKK